METFVNTRQYADDVLTLGRKVRGIEDVTQHQAAPSSGLVMKRKQNKIRESKQKIKRDLMIGGSEFQVFRYLDKHKKYNK
jgi:hypothetical protein